MQPIIRHFQINSGITGEGDVEHSENENVTKTIQRILGMSYYQVHSPYIQMQGGQDGNVVVVSLTRLTII